MGGVCVLGVDDMCMVSVGGIMCVYMWGGVVWGVCRVWSVYVGCGLCGEVVGRGGHL